MARKDELIDQLRRSAGGSPQDMAAVAGVEASDRSFRRALKDLIAEGALVAEGTTKNRTYRATGTEKRASGFGAAVDLGIAGGPRLMQGDRSVPNHAAMRRTEAFARMSARHFSSEP